MRKWVKTFKPEFAKLVVEGTKCSTIRPWPKDGKIPSMGDTLDARMWEGKPYHSKQMKLGCFEVISALSHSIEGRYEVWRTTQTGYRAFYGKTSLESISKDDGFKCWDDMFLWFHVHYPLPFKCVRIQWDPTKKVEA